MQLLEKQNEEIISIIPNLTKYVEIWCDDLMACGEIVDDETIGQLKNNLRFIVVLSKKVGNHELIKGLREHVEGLYAKYPNDKLPKELLTAF